MYSIYYALKDNEWEGDTFKSCSSTMVEAFMDAVREIRFVLMTKDVKLLVVGEMEFVIWAFGTCKGYLAIAECGPKTSEPDLDGG